MNDLEHLKEPFRRLDELMPERFELKEATPEMIGPRWRFEDKKRGEWVYNSFDTVNGDAWALFGPLLDEFGIRPWHLGRNGSTNREWRGGDPLTAVVLAVVDAVERKVKDETKTD